MGSRYLHRRSNGRFVQADLETTFGIRVTICPGCGAIHPHERAPLVEVAGFIDPASFNRLVAPTECRECKAPLPPS